MKAGKAILLSSGLLLLTSCATRYSYKHTSVDGYSCEVKLHSYRNLDIGKIRIDEECKVTGHGEGLKQDTGVYIELLKAVDKYIN